MSEFSCDILHNILIRLPAKDLFRLKVVSKLWKDIIDDPFFVKSHTKNEQSCAADILILDSKCGRLFSLSLDSLNMADGIQNIGLIPLKQLIQPGVVALPANSCNGLILISHEKSWAIWNPLVQDYHEVLPPPPMKYTLSFLLTSGFGYDETSDDYKVVRVDRVYTYEANANFDLQLEILYYRTLIYSLKSRCWREIEGFPGGDCYGNRGVYLNGALHWRSRDGIIALHLGREDHHLLSVPPPPSNYKWCWGSLDASDGCLILSYGHENNKRMDAWVMKDYGMDKAWTKLFSIVESDVRGLSVVAYLKSKGQVFLRRDGSNALKLLHLNNKSSKEITISGLNPYRLSYAQFCPGSLVRLDSAKRIRNDGVEWKRKEIFRVRSVPSNCMR